MKKKIDLFWYWFIFVVAFVLCFFVVNDKKINAYELDNNGNLVSSNLFNFNALPSTFGDGNKASVDYETQTITINAHYYNNSGVKLKDLAPSLIVGETYVLGLESTGPGIIYLTDSSFVWFSGSPRVITQSDLESEVVFYGGDTNVDTIIKIRINKGDVVLPYEPYGIWYSEINAEEKYQGRLPSFTSSLTYTNTDNGNDYSLNNLNSYIDNSFGYLYFDRVWSYLDTLTGSSYDNAKLTINFNENLNINTSYIINSTKENYGSGVWFYQNNLLMLDVRNFYNNEYCGGASQYSCNVDLNKYVNVGSGANSFSYLNKIVVWSATTDERTLAFGYNNIGYNTGYDNGYSVGYKVGKEEADTLNYDNGYSNGYNVGYDKGVNYASNGGNTLVGLVGAVFTAPVNMLHNIFDFEFLGINLTNFLFSLISLFLVIWLIRKFL